MEDPGSSQVVCCNRTGKKEVIPDEVNARTRVPGVCLGIYTGMTDLCRL